jgi:hypothetical protein
MTEKSVVFFTSFYSMVRVSRNENITGAEQMSLGKQKINFEFISSNLN